MKISEEYRALALDALRGKWKTAVLAGIIASAFGANIVSGSSSITSRSNQDSSFSISTSESARLKNELNATVFNCAVLKNHSG